MLSSGIFKWYCDQRGLIKPEIDSDLVVDMIYTLNMNFLLKEYYKSLLFGERFIYKLRCCIMYYHGIRFRRGDGFRWQKKFK